MTKEWMHIFISNLEHSYRDILDQWNWALSKKVLSTVWQHTVIHSCTWKENSGKPTKLPNQERTALTNSSMARKAMRLAAMLATSLMEDEAPAAAASRKFLSFLKIKPITVNLLKSWKVQIIMFWNQSRAIMMNSLLKQCISNFHICLCLSGSKK